MMWPQFSSKILPWRGVFTIASSVAVSVVAVGYTGLLQLLEWAVFDQFVRLRPSEPLEERIVVVAIDESDLNQVGTWPIPDTLLAALIENINTQKPRAIGLDLYRDLPEEPGYQKWVEVMQSTETLIGVEKGLGETVASPPALAKRDRVGLADLVLDADSKIRRALLSHPDEQGKLKLSLGARLSLMYLEKEGIQLEILDPKRKHLKLGQAVFVPFRKNDGVYVGANAGGYQILLNYRGQGDRFQVVSLAEVLGGKIPPDLMRDRLVLIGSVAPSLNDRYPTPYSSHLVRTPERTPGVIIHANLASQILSSALDGRSMLRVLPEAMEWCWVAIWSGTGTLGCWIALQRGGPQLKRSARWCKTVAGLGLSGGGLVAASYLAFLGGWWVPVVSPLLAVVGSAAIVTCYHSQRMQEESDRQLSQFLEAMPVGVAVLDRWGKPYYANHKAKQLLGKGVLPETTAEQLAQVYQLYLADTDGLYPSEQQPILRALQGETSSADDIEIRIGDRVIPLETWGTPIFDRSGNLTHALMAFQDISDRKKAEAKQAQFLAKLSQLNGELNEALRAELELTKAAHRFVPHQFLQLLGYQSIAEVKLGDAVQQDMSILFSDIRNFTTLSEQMTPEDNFKFINAYLCRMEPAIVEHNGFIDKYIGDGIMALFGGQTDADDAVCAGISMLRRLEEYNQTRQRSDRQPLKIGIGINTGAMMLGTVGGNDRIDSTVISDTVNLASRIEGLTKSYRVSLLISSNTFVHLEDPNRYHIRLIERLKVKGKSEMISFFEVFDADPPDLKKRKLEIKTEFEQGILSYYKRDFKKAQAFFQSCLEVIPEDPVTQLYFARCFGSQSGLKKINRA